MKKVFFLFSLLSAAALFSSCSNEEGGANPVQNTKPKTTVFLQVNSYSLLVVRNLLE